MQHTDWDPIRVLVLTDLDLGIHTRERLAESQSEGLWLVGTACSLEFAVDLIASASPQVIVVDIDGEYGPDTIADLAERCDARLLALTGCRDTEVQDGAVLAGARGIVQKREAADILVDAIRCVHEGEMWINHAAADRILDELAQAREAAEQQERIRTKLARLTLKERIIVAEITRSCSSTPREIAVRLQISEHRLQDHLVSIHRKLEIACGKTRVSGAAPEPVAAPLKAMPFDRAGANSGACCVARSITPVDGSPPGYRSQDPIVFPLGASEAEAVRASRWQRLRRIH